MHTAATFVEFFFNYSAVKGIINFENRKLSLLTFTAWYIQQHIIPYLHNYIYNIHLFMFLIWVGRGRGADMDLFETSTKTGREGRDHFNRNHAGKTGK